MEKIEQRTGMTPVDTLKFMNAGKTMYTSGTLAFRMDEQTLQTMTATEDQKLQKG